MFRALRLRSVGILGAAALGLAGLSPAIAQSDGPEVIASGLNNPRGLTFLPDGSLYVAEAGTGGSGPCINGPEGPTCFGLTGAVTRIDKNGQRQVITGLGSLGAQGSGAFAIGPSDVAFDHHGKIYVTEGLGLDLEVSNPIPELGDMGQLLRARPARNPVDVTTVADLAEFEDANNPTGDEENVNPNSVLAYKNFQIVSDAGANDLLRVGRNGRITVLATFPNRNVGGVTMDAVPTSVARGPDGALYVGQLTGAPFPVGGARVYRIPQGGGTPEIVARGFTNIIDIGFDNQGRLFVLEIFQNGLTSGDPTGALIRVRANGSKHIVMSDGLITPGGLAIRGNYAYVSNCGTCPGTGEVLRIPLT